MKPEIAIVGAGYVGVPLAETFGRAGRSVLLVEAQPARVEQLNRGESYIDDVSSETLRELVDAGLLSATSDYDAVREPDAILIALPTPLSAQREPDAQGTTHRTLTVHQPAYAPGSHDTVPRGVRAQTKRALPTRRRCPAHRS